MKITFLTILFLTLATFNLFAVSPASIQDQNDVLKNTATFSTKTMQATVQYNDVNLLTFNLIKTSNEKVKLQITQNGITIFSDSYTLVQSLNKGYDLSELPKGKYIVVITQGNQKFEKQFEKTFDGAYELENK
jgi:hypothetical protein